MSVHRHNAPVSREKNPEKNARTTYFPFKYSREWDHKLLLYINVGTKALAKRTSSSSNPSKLCRILTILFLLFSSVFSSGAHTVFQCLTLVCTVNARVAFVFREFRFSNN